MQVQIGEKQLPQAEEYLCQLWCIRTIMMFFTFCVGFHHKRINQILKIVYVKSSSINNDLRVVLP